MTTPPRRYASRRPLTHPGGPGLKTDPREMYTEIGALIGAIAQAFSITEADVVTAPSSAGP